VPALDSDPLFSRLRHAAEFPAIRSAAMDCKRSSWPTVANTASERISDRQRSDPQHPHPEASQSRVREAAIALKRCEIIDSLLLSDSIFSLRDEYSVFGLRNEAT
jgi:hypothetical protein